MGSGSTRLGSGVAPGIEAHLGMGSESTRKVAQGSESGRAMSLAFSHQRSQRISSNLDANLRPYPPRRA